MANHVFFIPGIFDRPIDFIMGTYFVDQFKYLDENNVPFTRLPINTTDGLDETAKVIKANIQKLDCVEIVTHSKGGTDILHTLIEYPEVREKVKKVVAIQAPFYGSPIADLLVGGKVRKKIADLFIKTCFGGTHLGLSDLKTKVRQEYMDHHKSEILSLTEQIDFRCVGTWKSREPGRLDTPLKFTRDYMEKRGLKNDGLVPFVNSFIPGAKKIVIPEIDHCAPVVRRSIVPFDRLELNKSILFGN